MVGVEKHKNKLKTEHVSHQVTFPCHHYLFFEKRRKMHQIKMEINKGDFFLRPRMSVTVHERKHMNHRVQYGCYI